MPLTSDERFVALMEALTGTEKQLENSESIYKDLRKTVRRIKVAMWVAIIGLVVDLALTIGLLFGFINTNALTNQVHQNQQQIAAEQDSTKNVECSLNSLFIQTDTPDAYAAAPNKQVYVQQYHIIYQERQQLGCQPAIAEPQRPTN
jgi:hypothetical protein